jgi:hypothetical protein
MYGKNVYIFEGKAAGLHEWLTEAIVSMEFFWCSARLNLLLP